MGIALRIIWYLLYALGWLIVLFFGIACFIYDRVLEGTVISICCIILLLVGALIISADAKRSRKKKRSVLGRETELFGESVVPGLLKAQIFYENESTVWWPVELEFRDRGVLVYQCDLKTGEREKDAQDYNQIIFEDETDLPFKYGDDETQIRLFAVGYEGPITIKLATPLKTTMVLDGYKSLRKKQAWNKMLMGDLLGQK